MIALALLIYIGIAIVIAALFFFPSAAARCLQIVRSFSTRFQEVFRRAGQRSSSIAHGSAGGVQGFSNSVVAFIAQQRYRIVLTVVLLGVPPGLVLLTRHPTTLGGFDPYAHPANVVVAQLLQGERLVPPPPLPPEVFSTPEVESARPALAGADRDWSRLDREFSQRLLHVIKQMHDQYGYDVVLLEGYRSPERQAMLARLGPSVTNAGAYQSYHQLGKAADCAFFRNGRLVISERDPWAMQGYQLFGQVAESLGLTWGGRWKLMDYGHIELSRVGRPRAIE